MKTDIIFISFNRKAEVEFNLNKMTNYQNINKIIWVDNGSSDGVCNIEYNKEKVELIALKENIGINAYNVGVSKSIAEIIIILDDDSHIEEYSINKAVKLFELDSQIGVLAFQIILPSTGEVVTKDWVEGSVTSFWGCGAAIRAHIWRQLKGYDENLFLYTNEYDFAIRVWNLGYKVLYKPELKAFHRVSNMNRSSSRLVSLSLKNNYRFIHRYFDDKYVLRLIVIDRFTWLIRSILSNSFGAYREGIKNASMFKDIEKYPIDIQVQKFYINNHRIFELPISKISRKIRNNSLFHFSKDV